jgi:hypothetical protein
MASGSIRQRDMGSFNLRRARTEGLAWRRSASILCRKIVDEMTLLLNETRLDGAR